MGSIPRPGGPFNVKRVAIIGGGPGGVAAAKFLVAEKAFDKIDIFEQQSDVGGVWNYTPHVSQPISIPQTTPDAPPDPPIWLDGAAAPIFSNALYSNLHTNIPKRLMQFSDQDFPPGSLLFPRREDVRAYLVKHAQDVRHLITFSHQVEEVHQDGDKWEVKVTSMITKETRVAEYDAVIVANGHYSLPIIPSVRGMEEFNSVHPSVIQHSKMYRSPDSFAGKKVVVVGSGPSGLLQLLVQELTNDQDIGTQISQVCKKPMLNSVRTSSSLKLGQDRKEEVPVIAEFLAAERGVRFEDGRVERDIDAVVYCTGYFYSYHFLRSLDPPVITDGHRVRGLYKQLFDIHHPTLAFLGLPQKVIPFPVSEVQSAAIAKVWANKLSLPEREEMLRAEEVELGEMGVGRTFHVFGYPRDAKYLNGLHDWVKTASDGFAKVPAVWDERHRWEREIFADLRKTFVETGQRAQEIEELGFRFEDRQREQD